MSVQAISWAWSQTVGSPTRKSVLVSLANRHNADTGKCCPKVERIANELEINEKTVRRALAKLEEDGFISRRRSRHRDGYYGVYHYTLKLDFQAQPPVRESGSPPVRESGPEPEVNLEPSEPNGSVTAQTLVGEFVDSAKKSDLPVDRRFIGHLARETKRLLDEGFTGDQIRSAYGRMAERGVIQPSLLGNFMLEAALPRREPMRYGRGMTTEQILNMAKEDR